MSPEQNPIQTTNNVEEKSITQAEWADLDSAGNASREDSQAARELATELAGAIVETGVGRKSTIIKVMNPETGRLEERPVSELAKDYLSNFPDVLKLLNEQERALREGNDWTLRKD